MLNRMLFVENAFDKNDWFVIASCLLFFGFAMLLPKRLSARTVCLLLMYPVAVAILCDNSIGYGPFDYYDIMDGPKYTVMDLAAYLLYAPFGYFFIYFYLSLRVRGIGTVFYVLAFSALSVGFEWLCHAVGVFHYKNGYRILYSFVIYLFVQTSTIQFYKYIRGFDSKR